MSKEQRNGTATTATKVARLPGAWDTARVLEVLGTRMAMSAMRGKAQPITAAVVRRLETATH